MPADNPSSKPPLSARLRVDQLAAILRVDQVRHDTLVELVASWTDPDARDDIITQLDALAEAVASPCEGELDALVEQVEDAAGMESAEIEIRLPDVERLRDELHATVSTLARFNPFRLSGRRVPRQQDRRSA